MDRKDLWWIKNAYWEQTAGEISSLKKIKHSVRQGNDCAKSRTPRNQSRKAQGRQLEICWWHSINCKKNKEDLQKLLDVEEKSRKKGLELNSKKTEVMVVSGNNECPQINIFISGNKLKQRDQFKYLGTLISSHRNNKTEIVSRIALAKVFREWNRYNKYTHLHSHRKRALEYFIEPILMWLQSLDIFKTLAKETGGNSNATNLRDSKEIKHVAASWQEITHK